MLMRYLLVYGVGDRPAVGRSPTGAVTTFVMTLVKKVETCGGTMSSG